MCCRMLVVMVVQTDGNMHVPQVNGSGGGGPGFGAV